MSEKISWTLNVQVESGPKISESKTITVEAYDKIEVTIKDKATEEEVWVQPGDKGQVQFLLIKSDEYGDKLTYTVNVAATTSSISIIKLDALQLFMGDGVAELLDKNKAPEKLFFTNNLGKDVSIEILVGRKATKVATP